MFSPTQSGSQTSFEAGLLTNNGAGGPLVHRGLEQDECTCGGISNGIDGSGGGSEWPKVVSGKEAFRKTLQNHWNQESGSGSGRVSTSASVLENEEDALVDELCGVLR